MDIFKIVQYCFLDNFAISVIEHVGSHTLFNFDPYLWEPSRPQYHFFLQIEEKDFL